MFTPKRYLTKSRFKLATDCPTKLYYSGKTKEFKDSTQEDTFLAMLAEGGYQVGALAKLRYPDGIEIEERGHAEASAKTLEYLDQENVVLFEPAILVGDFFIRIDILVKKGNQFELIEVKAKSYDSLNPEIAGKRKSISSEYLPYIQDAAFQTWVLQQAFTKSEITTFLMMPDKAHPSSIDGLNQMFKIGERSEVTLNIPKGLDTKVLAETLLAKVCVDQYVAEVLSTSLAFAGGEGVLSDLAQAWANAYKNDAKIKPVIGKHCGGCQFKAKPEDGLKSGFHECWKQANNWQDKDFEGGTVLDVWNFRKKQELIEQGICKISQITREDIGDFEEVADEAGLSRAQRQWLQVRGHADTMDIDLGNGDIDHVEINNWFYFNNAFMQLEMSNWQYPYHMIDFETATVALPFYAGMRPYEAIAFQFSHHIMEANGSVRHAGEFLCTEPGVFPNYTFARALKNALENDNGSVFMWSHHENTILSTIIRQLTEDPKAPADAAEIVAFLKTLVKGGERAMVDLCTIAEKAFFHPDTKGSNSIKQVLPAAFKTTVFLENTYSKPVYGFPSGIKSLNFASEKGFAWVEPNTNGSVTDPYAKLKQYATDLLPNGLTTLEDEASVIADGGAAATAYARLQFEEMNENTRQKINAALLRYCELDTLAMVMITQAWQSILV